MRKSLQPWELSSEKLESEMRNFWPVKIATDAHRHTRTFFLYLRLYRLCGSACPVECEAYSSGVVNYIKKAEGGKN